MLCPTSGSFGAVNLFVLTTAVNHSRNCTIGASTVVFRKMKKKLNGLPVEKFEKDNERMFGGEAQGSRDKKGQKNVYNAVSLLM